jgi:hypothetical protein
LSTEEIDKAMLNEHDQTIKDNILPRLVKVEEAQEALSGQMGEMQGQMGKMQNDVTKVQAGQSQLELTVMKDGEKTRDLLEKFVTHVLDQSKAAAKTKEKVTLKQLSVKEKIILGAFGVISGGGGLAACFMAISQFFQ